MTLHQSEAVRAIRDAEEALRDALYWLRQDELGPSVERVRKAQHAVEVAEARLLMAMEGR